MVSPVSEDCSISETTCSTFFISWR